MEEGSTGSSGSGRQRGIDNGAHMWARPSRNSFAACSHYLLLLSSSSCPPPLLVVVVIVIVVEMQENQFRSPFAVGNLHNKVVWRNLHVNVINSTG